MRARPRNDGPVARKLRPEPSTFPQLKQTISANVLHRILARDQFVMAMPSLPVFVTQRSAIFSACYSAVSTWKHLRAVKYSWKAIYRTKVPSGGAFRISAVPRPTLLVVFGLRKGPQSLRTSLLVFLFLCLFLLSDFQFSKTLSLCKRS